MIQQIPPPAAAVAQIVEKIGMILGIQATLFR